MQCHFNYKIDISMSSSLNINEIWHAVKSYNETTLDGIKTSKMVGQTSNFIWWLMLYPEFEIWYPFSKMTKSSLNIHRKWHLVILVSNNVTERWNAVWLLIWGPGIQIWHLFFKMSTSSLNIHRKWHIVILVSTTSQKGEIRYDY